jgi:hypothetical protein
MAETNICREAEKRWKAPYAKDHLLTLKWQDANAVYTLSTAHKGKVNAPASRVAWEKIKLLSVTFCRKYMIGVNKLLQLQRVC